MARVPCRKARDRGRRWAVANSCGTQDQEPGPLDDPTLGGGSRPEYQVGRRFGFGLGGCYRRDDSLYAARHLESRRLLTFRGAVQWSVTDQLVGGLCGSGGCQRQLGSFLYLSKP